jgi:hypothetical protein
MTIVIDIFAGIGVVATLVVLYLAAGFLGLLGWGR